MTSANKPPATDDTTPIPPRYWWLKRILLAVGVLILALAVLRWWWGVEAERRLQAKIDEYHALGQPVTIEDFQYPSVPDEENAAHFLKQAAATLFVPPDIMTDFADVCGDLEFVAEYANDVAKLVAANDKTLDLARQARSKSGVEWKFPAQSPVATPVMQERSAQRQLARLLSATATYYHHVGDDCAAIQTLRDSLAHAMTVRRMPGPMIAELTAQAIEGLAIATVEEITPALRIETESDQAASESRGARPQEVRGLVTTLLDETRLHEGWCRAMYAERREALDLVDLVSRGTNPATVLGAGNAPSLGPLGVLFKPMFQTDALLMMDYYSALADTGSESSFAAARDHSRRYPSFASGIERNAHLLSRALLPGMDRALELRFRGIAMRRMAATALVVRMYEVEHGQRPNQLTELVPEYLPAIPADPFAPDDRHIGYHPDARKAVLYSVNTDGIDDGGEYVRRDSGDVDWDVKDLVFFLNGDRPSGSPQSSTRPTTQAVKGEGDEVSGQRQTNQDAEEADADD